MVNIEPSTLIHKTEDPIAFLKYLNMKTNNNFIK